MDNKENKDKFVNGLVDFFISYKGEFKLSELIEMTESYINSLKEELKRK